MAAEDARYRQSSQFKLWSFSPAQLAELRSDTNKLARESISERLLLLPPQGNGNGNGNGGSNNGGPSTPGGGGGGAGSGGSGPNTPLADSGAGGQQQPQQLPEFLTPAEERQLVDYYTVELLRAGKFMALDTEIQATAAVFFRRFYVTSSIMTYPPTEMLKTSLFFGAKAESVYPGLDWFAEKFPNTKRDNILAGEFLLCQGIRFSFDVRHPFRALEGATMELRRLAAFDDGRINRAHDRAREILKFSPLITDAYFHYTPSQIMLAALALADAELVDRIVAETFRHAASPPSSSTPADDANGASAAPTAAATKSTGSRKKAELHRERIMGTDVRDRVMARVEACRHMLAVELPERFTEYWGNPESNNIIKPLNRKLKKCRDPDRWDLVALQQAKKESTVKDKATKTNKNGSAAADDVFGPSNDEARDPKRRKVTGGRAPDDQVFGPSLKKI